MIISKFSELKKILKNSYSPYSKFKTAAIVVTDKGNFAGVNVENSSYAATVCAERNAIFSAIANGAKKFKSLYVISSSKRKDIVPCAVCLQVMNEFFGPNTEIIFFNINGASIKYKFSQLLPFSFNKKQLKKN